MAELIAALDFDKPEIALALARLLKPQLNWCKVGLELFISAGPPIVKDLKKLGYKVFLDLKIYDIPNTAIRAAIAAANLGADMLTIHCQGGEIMCASVASALFDKFIDPPLVIGVTALTSFEDGGMPGIYSPVEEYAQYLAEQANLWAISGVVCAPGEAARIKAKTDLLCVCPGIRPSGSRPDDQGRIATPAMAIANGADFLVVGRPISQSADPVAATAKILAEMAKA